MSTAGGGHEVSIAEQYSHLNGYEHILVHKPQVWQDIVAVIDLIDAEACRTRNRTN